MAHGMTMNPGMTLRLSAKSNPKGNFIMARIYVGTFSKYNSGSIKGAWLNLENYSDKDAFLSACRELHKDESDPELMFQDYEGFPKSLYSESSVSDELWQWLELDEDDRELLAIYQDNVNQNGDIDEARDNFTGKFDSESDWAANFLEDTGGLEGVPEHLRNYIDFEAYARDTRLGGDMVFVRQAGEVWAFHSC
jgi:antirestriction protein